MLLQGSAGNVQSDLDKVIKSIVECDLWREPTMVATMLNVQSYSHHAEVCFCVPFISYCSYIFFFLAKLIFCRHVVNHSLDILSFTLWRLSMYYPTRPKYYFYTMPPCPNSSFPVTQLLATMQAHAISSTCRHQNHTVAKLYPCLNFLIVRHIGWRD
jgi:hypothetical protein